MYVICLVSAIVIGLLVSVKLNHRKEFLRFVNELASKTVFSEASGKVFLEMLHLSEYTASQNWVRFKNLPQYSTLKELERVATLHLLFKTSSEEELHRSMSAFAAITAEKNKVIDVSFDENHIIFKMERIAITHTA